MIDPKIVQGIALHIETGRNSSDILERDALFSFFYNKKSTYKRHFL